MFLLSLDIQVLFFMINVLCFTYFFHSLMMMIFDCDLFSGTFCDMERIWCGKMKLNGDSDAKIKRFWANLRMRKCGDKKIS